MTQEEIEAHIRKRGFTSQKTLREGWELYSQVVESGMTHQAAMRRLNESLDHRQEMKDRIKKKEKLIEHPYEDFKKPKKYYRGI